jgi:uncharacterized repeat protein (TIGR01451 family)
MKMFLAMLALCAPGAALAANDVAVASKVMVERVKQAPDGSSRIVREEPGVVTPGDRLVFLLSYRNGGTASATGFRVTNPIPAAISFAGGESEGATVSIDGGKSWGPLASLRVANPDGTSRPASAADVTHIRWAFSQPIAAGTAGELSFRGVVK